MYVIYRQIGDRKDPIGFFDTMAEAVQALEEERKKEDTGSLWLMAEGEEHGGNMD